MEDLLKEFWPVAIFFVISIISYMRNEAKEKQQKGDAQQPQPQTLDENFPQVEIYESPAPPTSDPIKPMRSTGKKPASKKYEPATGIIKSVESPQTATAERGIKVALKGKSDVKKAFIYSEILNRKYK